MKPAMGFTLPSAGLTPAPSGRKSRNGEDAISLPRSGRPVGQAAPSGVGRRARHRFVSFQSDYLCHPEPVRLRSGQAPPRDPGSFSMPAEALSTTDLPRRVKLDCLSLSVSFRALRNSSASTRRSPERSRRGRIPDPFLPRPSGEVDVSPRASGEGAGIEHNANILTRAKGASSPKNGDLCVTSARPSSPHPKLSLVSFRANRRIPALSVSSPC